MVEFQSLDIIFPDLTGRGPPPRQPTGRTPGPTAAASRRSSASFAVRAGYYQDKTPQPVDDVGPILADNDRNAYTLGFGYNTERWGVDVSDLYIEFKDRDTAGPVARQLLRARTRNRPTSSRSVSGSRSNRGEQR